MKTQATGGPEDGQIDALILEALEEVSAHFSTAIVKGDEPALEWELGQVLRFVQSCGVLIGEEDGRDLVAGLREAGYATSVEDGTLRFQLHRRSV